jgi:hypothetical protein
MLFILSGLLNKMFWNQNTMDYYMEIIIKYGIRTDRRKKMGDKIWQKLRKSIYDEPRATRISLNQDLISVPDLINSILRIRIRILIICYGFGFGFVP